MGALNSVWFDNTVKKVSKYLILCTIPCNLLMWGCESWAILESTLSKLEVFLHINVIKILKITKTMVIYEKTTNESVQKRFFNIPTIRYQLAKQQLNFIRKVVRNSGDQIPTQILTVLCDNKHKPGAPLQNNKKDLSQNIRLIVSGAEKYGLLTTWVYLALYDGYWAHLVKKLGTHPLTWKGAEPNPQSTPPPRSSRRTATLSTHPCRQAPPNSPPPFCARDPHFTTTPPRRNVPQPSQKRESSPRCEESPRRTQSNSQNYDPEKVVYTRTDSLGILNPSVSYAAT